MEDVVKKLILIIILVILADITSAQTAGVSLGFMENGEYAPFGFSLNAEYNMELSEKFELTFLASLIYNSENSPVGKRKYFTSPVCAGIRYYFTKAFISPYISLESGISYANYDLLDERFIDLSSPSAGTKLEMNSHSKILLGIGPTVGTNISLNENLKLNLNGRFYFQSDRYADFITYNAGIIFDM
jgi:hypothetical protein